MVIKWARSASPITCQQRHKKAEANQTKLHPGQLLFSRKSYSYIPQIVKLASHKIKILFEHFYIIMSESKKRVNLDSCLQQHCMPSQCLHAHASQSLECVTPQLW